MDDVAVSPKFDGWRDLIERARTSQKLSWDDLIKLGTQEWLNNHVKLSFLPEITPLEWGRIVTTKMESEQESRQIEQTHFAEEDDSIIGRDIDSDITVPGNSGSSWKLYESHLLNSKWNKAAVESIENISLAVLKKMSRSTFRKDKQNEIRQEAVKGLVTGHVQSGKTANIAGLMALGADNGYNMFIILSGTINSLRVQTQDRLYNDLNYPDKKQNLNWRYIDKPSLSSPMGDLMSNLYLGETSKDRFMTVSLKNKKRLEDLLSWITKDENKLRQLKLVIIDDEADQASINTGRVDEDERKAINNLIVELTKIKAKAVNYIAYTATPYANFLNEAYPESLYPRNFIAALPQPNEHFGPKQIFGLSGSTSTGLDIIREISEKDLTLLRDGIHSSSSTDLPESLKNSLAWFFCAGAAFRKKGIKKPASMLIHTSQRVDHHDRAANAVKTWLSKSDEVKSYCKDIWEFETKEFTLESFEEQYPEYGLMDQVENYPNFSDIEPHIHDMLRKITHIPLSEDGQIEYHTGTHLCIDNNRSNRIDDENQLRRLIYPSKALTDAGRLIEMPDVSTAFIVIGGSTLSRGLTLEGLISTYFIRDSKQIDTLMQMGRWFGYRRGYELLQRIWMTKSCREKFEYMVSVEYDLRKELRSYMEPPFVDPKEFGPRVKNSPSLSWLRPTAKNRMQNSEHVDLDFSGANSQTTMFYTSAEILRKNIVLTDEFLSSLGEAGKIDNTRLVWYKVSFKKIIPFIEGLNYHKRSYFFSNIKAFISWFEKTAKEAEYTDWNVIAAGIDTSRLGNRLGHWSIGKHKIGKVSRTRLKRSRDDGAVAIGALRAPKDLVGDVDGMPTVIERFTDDNVRDVRKNAGLEKTPQLIIYRISKDSKAERENSKTRLDLDTEEDIIGISIWVPGVRKSDGNPNFAASLRVNIPDIAIENDSDPEVQ